MTVYSLSGKIIVYAGLGLFMAAGIAATHTPPEKPAWKNLKIIPKDIEEEQMDRIMYQFAHQLGVTCSYCHPDTKPGIFPVTVDFVTDELPEKATSRKMMLMTDRLNKKYFGYKNDYGFESLKNIVVTCNTCHRGLTKPNNMKLFNN
jgi:Photosynthetic reaction centre cytochrome C subunit